MKVLLVNGSPHENGCTARALAEIATTLHACGVESEIFQLGADAIGGCRGCGACGKLGHCVIEDKVNAFAELAKDADGFIFGSPVHYAAASGNITAFMDRLFYSDMCGRRRAFYLKPAAAIVCARRGGTTAALDQLNKYFTISQMPVVPSCYWNMVHGSTPAQVEEDAEGMQVMRTLARNMAWMLKCREAANAAGVELPERERRVFTNFIR